MMMFSITDFPTCDMREFIAELYVPDIERKDGFVVFDTNRSKPLQEARMKERCKEMCQCNDADNYSEAKHEKQCSELISDFDARNVMSEAHYELSRIEVDWMGQE